MKVIYATTLAATFLVTPLALQAATSMSDVEAVVTASQDYGITHFREIEFEDGNRTEVEGWVGEDWYVELDLSGSNIDHEDREKRIDGPWGMSAEEVRQVARAAMDEGITRIEEIKIRSNGSIEVEGDDANGREIEVSFRQGNNTPVGVERDD